MALTTLEHRDPEREDSDRLLVLRLVEVFRRHEDPHPNPLWERLVCHEEVVVSTRTKIDQRPVDVKHAFPFFEDKDD